MPRSVLLLHVLFCSLSAAWAQDPVKVGPKITRCSWKMIASAFLRRC